MGKVMKTKNKFPTGQVMVRDRYSLAPRWLPQVEGLRCRIAAISLSKYTKVCLRRTHRKYKKVSTAPEVCWMKTKVDVDLHTTTNNFATNEYRGVVNPSGLAVYKGSNTK